MADIASDISFDDWLLIGAHNISQADLARGTGAVRLIKTDGSVAGSVSLKTLGAYKKLMAKGGRPGKAVTSQEAASRYVTAKMSAIFQEIGTGALKEEGFSSIAGSLIDKRRIAYVNKIVRRLQGGKAREKDIPTLVALAEREMNNFVIDYTNAAAKEMTRETAEMAVIRLKHGVPRAEFGSFGEVVEKVNAYAVAHPEDKDIQRVIATKSYNDPSVNRVPGVKDLREDMATRVEAARKAEVAKKKAAVVREMFDPESRVDLSEGIRYEVVGEPTAEKVGTRTEPLEEDLRTVIRQHVGDQRGYQVSQDVAEGVSSAPTGSTGSHVVDTPTPNQVADKAGDVAKGTRSYVGDLADSVVSDTTTTIKSAYTGGAGGLRNVVSEAKEASRGRSVGDIFRSVRRSITEGYRGIAREYKVSGLPGIAEKIRSAAAVTLKQGEISGHDMMLLKMSITNVSGLPSQAPDYFPRMYKIVNSMSNPGQLANVANAVDRVAYESWRAGLGIEDLSEAPEESLHALRNIIIGKISQANQAVIEEKIAFGGVGAGLIDAEAPAVVDMGKIKAAQRWFCAVLRAAE